MSAPRVEMAYKHIQNPGASMPLIIPILVLCNTSDEDLARNIRMNAAKDLPWLKAQDAHGLKAIMVGGGPSAADHLWDIRELQAEGGVVFAMNAASQWLRSHGIEPDYQVICDAKEETASLVDPKAPAHLFASQVNPATMDAVDYPVIWHLDIGDVEQYLPKERVQLGGYALLGGGASVGNSALCVAYAMGFRDLHCFGYDSSHRGEASHAYEQPMNAWIPTVDVEWAGRSFVSSVAMKAQAEKFQITAQALKHEGCKIAVYGDGLLQHMYTALPQDLTERDKYRLMWQFDSYREVAPGELTVDVFLSVAKPNGLILDFGCGTGRAALKMNELGHDVLLIDFADNCRDQEAMGLPFLEWDLTRPCPARGKVGFCSDMMEHIPAKDVHTVLANIMEAAPRVFFRIDTEDDLCGSLIGQTLHVTVQDHAAWLSALERHGSVTFAQECGGFSLFMVERS